MTLADHRRLLERPRAFADFFVVPLIRPQKEEQGPPLFLPFRGTNSGVPEPVENLAYYFFRTAFGVRV